MIEKLRGPAKKAWLAASLPEGPFKVPMPGAPNSQK